MSFEREGLVREGDSERGEGEGDGERGGGMLGQGNSLTP